MSEYQVMNLFVTIGAMFAFVYGLISLFKNKRGYFYSFAVLGLFSFAMGRVFMLFLSLIHIENTGVFSIGSLGTVSGFMCLSFACNSIEKIDSIDVENTKKYKRIALIMPIMYFVFLILLIIGKLGFEELVIFILFAFSSMPCSYYCLRNAVTPYSKNSFMGCMRPFFIAVLALCITAETTELTWLIDATSKAMTVLSVLFTVLGTICYIAIAILLERGNRKWIKM